ncbi:hypothetical protein TNCV_1092071 [Trichonephila clavipes]|nr:hypothetical protein TNCV_1092071 [Trichonephila clavipes]
MVIKGLPKNSNIDLIKADLEELGFLPEKVTQLIGSRTKQKLSVLIVTLPRSIENLKIFDLKAPSQFNITVDGYNLKGVNTMLHLQ